MKRVKVYRFKTFDAITGGYVISLRLGTRCAIKKTGAKILESTETEVLLADIDSEEFTTIDFLA